MTAAREAKTEAIRNLTGRGGIGLVTFHLARNKIEFVVTPERFPAGDIWVLSGTSKYSIEVKTCRKVVTWQIKKSQIPKMDFYVLTSMDTAECFVLRAMDIAELTRDAPILYGDVCMLPRSKVPTKALNAWKQIDGSATETGQPLSFSYNRNGFTKGYTRDKQVTKTLADGTVKTYFYKRTSNRLIPKLTTNDNRPFCQDEEPKNG